MSNALRQIHWLYLLNFEFNNMRLGALFENIRNN